MYLFGFEHSNLSVENKTGTKYKVLLPSKTVFASISLAILDAPYFYAINGLVHFTFQTIVLWRK